MKNNKKFWTQGRMVSITLTMYIVCGEMCSLISNTQNKLHLLFLGPLLFMIPLFVILFIYYKKIVSDVFFAILCILSFVFFIGMILHTLSSQSWYNFFLKLDKEFYNLFRL